MEEEEDVRVNEACVLDSVPFSVCACLSVCACMCVFESVYEWIRCLCER